MSDKTQPPSREATPGPKADAAATKPADTPATEAPTTDTGDAAAAAAARSSADTIRPAEGAAPRTPLNGLYSGSLEEEVGQVMKGLGSFWGGLKKKSWSTYATLKEDAEKTVAQLQEEAKQLSNSKVEIVRKDEAEWEAEQAEEAEKKKIKAEVERAQREAEAAVKDKGKGKEVDAPPSPTRTTAILDRLSTSTTQFQSTFQTTINNTLAAAKANPALADPAALRAKLAENLHLSSARENLTLSFQQAEKFAEEYLKKGGEIVKDVQQKGGEIVKDVQTKSETWVKDAEQWVEENVKLVAPPDEGQTFVSMGGWDGGDFYSFSTSSPTTETAESRTPRASLSSAAIAGSRKEALLRRLREDKDLLMVDPAGEAETQERRDEFANWIADKWPTAQKDGREEEEGNVGAIRMALVPETLTDEQFWQRYLFHRDMIEAADTKRKLLLQATQEQEATDDFNWDDDDEDDESKASASASGAADKPSRPDSATPTDKGAKTPAASTPVAKDAPPAPAPAAAAAPATAAKSSAGTSPRDSEESFDVVSDQRTATATEDDDDSDWE
ncbi:hypothetical protein Q8F55_006577 [Vanrija albida]|uniref:BSD domain-containing protein n=1 Tax=Vanrija albida TaxID=181172 RepID=A0ABR3PYG6_9TREE